MKPAAPLLICLALASCKAPTVHLATPEPVKVDIAMRIDVYQHGKEEEKKSTAAPKSADAAKERTNRLAEIQALKNSRIVGEA
ncbi:MAG: hypothetical protein ACKOAS_06445, partial [Verrucomicrobiota bacterium]